MAGNYSPHHSPQGPVPSLPTAVISSPPLPTSIVLQNSTAPTTASISSSKATLLTDSLNYSSGVSLSPNEPESQAPPTSTSKALPLDSTPPRPRPPPLATALSPTQKATVTSPYKRPGDSDSSSSNPAPLSASKASASGPSQKRQRRTPKAGKASDESPVPPNTTEADEDSETRMASERPRLSEQEKKNNHIASEQKRRMAIREGFDRLTEIVPGLEGQGRSESIVLKKSVDHMRDVLNERQQLIQKIQALGGEVPPELR